MAGGILGYARVYQSIPGFRGYLSTRVYDWLNLEYARVSQDSKDVGLWMVESWEYARVSQDSVDTFPRGSMAGGILG